MAFKKNSSYNTNWYTGNGGASSFRDSYYGVVGITADKRFVNLHNNTTFPPNPSARAAAMEALGTMSFTSNNNHTGLDYLIGYIDRVQKKMYATETQYLSKKLKKLSMDPYFTDRESEGRDMIEAIERAKQDGNYSEAFSLLMHCKESLADIQDQIAKEVEAVRTTNRTAETARGMSKLNQLYENVDIGKILEKRRPDLLQKLEESYFVDDKGRIHSADNEFYIELVQEITDEVFRNIESDPNFDVGSLRMGIANQLTDALKTQKLISADAEQKKLINEYKRAETARRKEIKSLLGTEGAAWLKKNIPYYTKVKNEKRKNNTVIRETLSKINTGKLGELLTQLLGKGAGFDYWLATGDFKKDRDRISGGVLKGESQITDSIGVEIYNDRLKKEFLKYLEKQYKTLDDKAEAYLAAIEELREKHKNSAEQLNDFFEIQVNTKAYRSSRDLGIRYDGPIDVAAGRLKTISNIMRTRGGTMSSTSVRKIEDADARRYIRRAHAIDDLIFMLNNTFEKGFASNMIGQLQNLLASVCWVWLWDAADIDMTLLEDCEKNDIKRIFLFQSGTAFFSGSQILKEALSYITSGMATDFIRVNITPAQDIDDNYYSSLRAEFPVVERGTVEDDNGVKHRKNLMSYADRQAALKKRWENLRNKSLKGTRLSIDFNQAALDRLLGNLSVVARL